MFIDWKSNRKPLRQTHEKSKLFIEYSNYCRCFHTLVGTRYHSKNILNGIFTLIFKKKYEMDAFHQWMTRTRHVGSCNLASKCVLWNIISKSLCMDISHNLDFKFACWGCSISYNCLFWSFVNYIIP